MINIQAKKLDLIEWISKLDDTSVIDLLRQVKEDYSKSKDWYETLKKDEIESINRGLKDLDEGKMYSHDTVRKVYEKYL